MSIFDQPKHLLEAYVKLLEAINENNEQDQVVYAKILHDGIPTGFDLMRKERRLAVKIMSKYMIINEDTVWDRLREIGKYADEGDFERAHSLQDKLYVDTLIAIRDQAIELGTVKRLAGAALKAQAIEFKRKMA